MGFKGGACGGGYAQVLPSDKVNLHLTGDHYAVANAQNLCASLLITVFTEGIHSR